MNLIMNDLDRLAEDFCLSPLKNHTIALKYRDWLREEGQWWIWVMVEDAWFYSVTDSALEFAMYVPWIKDANGVDPDLIDALRETTLDFVNANMSVKSDIMTVLAGPARKLHNT